MTDSRSSTACRRMYDKSDTAGPAVVCLGMIQSGLAYPHSLPLQHGRAARVVGHAALQQQHGRQHIPALQLQQPPGLHACGASAHHPVHPLRQHVGALQLRVEAYAGRVDSMFPGLHACGPEHPTSV